VAKERVEVEILTEVKKSLAGLAKYAAAIGVAVMAAKKMVAIGKEATQAFMEQEKAEQRLKASLMATGREASVSMARMKALASELQQTTIYGDEVTLSAMSMLQSLSNLNQKGLEQITPAIQDFASAMGVDLNTAASLVGKTLGSSTNALSRYGVEIDATGTKEEKLAELTQALNDKFGGMAEAIGDTTYGAFEKLNNIMGDSKELMGEYIALALTPLIDKTQEFVSAKLNEQEMINRVYQINKGLIQPEEMDYEYKLAKIVELEKQRKELSDQLWDQNLSKRKRRILQDELENVELNISGGRIRLQQMRDIIDANEELRQQADDEADRLAQITADQKALNDQYAKTKQGQIDSLQATIDYFEEFKKGPKAVSVLEMLYERMKSLKGITEDAGDEVDELIQSLADQATFSSLNLNTIANALSPTGFDMDAWLKKFGTKAPEADKYKDYYFEEDMGPSGAGSYEASQEYADDWIQAEEDRRNAALARIADEMAATEQRYNMEEERALHIQQILDEQAAHREEEANNIIDKYGAVAEAIGQAVVNQEAGLESLKDAVKDIAVTLLKSLAEEYVVRALASLVPGPTFNPAAAAGYGAVAAAALAASGAVQAFAQGGIVTSPTVGLVGEAGPEAIIPLDKAGGLGGVTIVVQGSLIHERELEGLVSGIVATNARLY
jgi:hypothetical protein